MKYEYCMDEFPITREFGDGEHEILLTVEVVVYPGSPGRSYMPNGDPGYPPEPPELDVISAIDPLTGKDWTYDLTKDDFDRLWNWVNDYHNNEPEPEPD